MYITQNKLVWAVARQLDNYSNCNGATICTWLASIMG